MTKKAASMSVSNLNDELRCNGTTLPGSRRSRSLPSIPKVSDMGAAARKPVGVCGGGVLSCRLRAVHSSGCRSRFRGIGPGHEESEHHEPRKGHGQKADHDGESTDQAAASRLPDGPAGRGTPPLWFAAWLTYVFFGMLAILALASLAALAHGNRAESS